jgi:hypothetical protein
MMMAAGRALKLSFGTAIAETLEAHGDQCPPSQTRVVQRKASHVARCYTRVELYRVVSIVFLHLTCFHMSTTIHSASQNGKLKLLLNLPFGFHLEYIVQDGFMSYGL